MPPAVEAAALSAAFVTALRRAGLSCSPDRAVRLAEALRLVPPADVETLYWASRVVLVSAHGQLPAFDAVFAAVFRAGFDPAAPPRTTAPAAPPPGPPEQARTRPSPAEDRAPGNAPADPRATPPVAAAGPDSDGDNHAPEREAVLAMASTDEQLHAMAFAQLTDAEVLEIRRLASGLLLATPTRLSRRTRKSTHSSARLDVRATVRASRRSGTDTTGLLYARRREQRRKLVMLCDVSGSMEPYARIFISLLQGAVATAGAEAFGFSTRLTRLTRQLALRDPDEALARAAEAAPDWAGGTRIADSIRHFVDDHGRRGLARGAVVVIFSDGWAQEDPDNVAAQMARLRRLAQRIIWVNPRKAAPEYQPLAGGMAAALPYCDAFVSGHSYTALAAVAAAIRGDSQPSLKGRGN
ncbi:VWA domain-containing protein [Arthrobacter sp. AL08]|uniref:vWA domain-containing protein n=2 Tax=Micrococcales TaxID=85006 RepID=UPI00249AC629|nr:MULTISPECIES: VWA domain-containing protein [Micrococcaceae]MDI3241895.1 VWA domain-containing protein [Arthrobacter sp. AL05]MDI3277781.1 VWA domain-containing protein [Arthrobacter sp. AL08]MDJ0351847.1 VWA domain-containing protein [Pseudarthrobacter sp. PH31-O2]WGZ81030.1 VWA domain-containing protein [Arthrobacter sp. EM1]